MPGIRARKAAKNPYSYVSPPRAGAGAVVPGKPTSTKGVPIRMAKGGTSKTVSRATRRK